MEKEFSSMKAGKSSRGTFVIMLKQDTESKFIPTKMFTLESFQVTRNTAMENSFGSISPILLSLNLVM